MLWKETAAIQLVGLTKIPMIVWSGAQVIRLDESGCEVKIPLNYFTRNHVGSLYFGAFAVGGDLAAGLCALKVIRERYAGVVPIFKDFHADYFKLADGDAVFRCTQGAEIVDAVARCYQSRERVTIPVQVRVVVPKRYGDEPVAQMTLGLSLKRKHG
jgi:acyl-coenzyme A thioesterase PaaI-like protein